MKRQIIIMYVLLILTLSFKSCITGQKDFRKPNIIIILSDDQGWGDLGITGNTNIETIEKLVEQVAVKIYNDLPLVEGIVMDVQDDRIILSIGSQVGVRKGTKCVAYKEGKVYYHPTTGEIAGKDVSPLGELIVVQVQEKMSIAKPIGTVSKIEIEDKVVVK